MRCDTPAAPGLPAPEWRLGSTARRMHFDTSADAREAGSEAPPAADDARTALTAHRYARRVARPLAFPGQEHGAQPGPAPCGGQPGPQHAGMRPEASARRRSRVVDLQQPARQPPVDSSNSRAPLSPLSRLSPNLRAPDSAGRSAERKQLPATPFRCLQLQPTGSPATNKRSAATPVSGELPPRWRAPKRRSICRHAEASTATAVPPGAATTSVASPLQRQAGTPAGASQRGHVASGLQEKQVVPETPMHKSSSSSTVQAVSRADTRTGGSPLSSGLCARTSRREVARQLPLQHDGIGRSDAEQMLQTAALHTTPLRGGRMINAQPAADPELKVMLAHSDSGHRDYISEAVNGGEVLRVGSFSGDMDLPAAGPVVSAAETGMLPVVDTQAALTHVKADALQHARGPLPTAGRPCLPPSADDSFVPPTQSPAHSPCSTQDSEQRQSSDGKRRRRSVSESFDPDRAVVPETLAWHANHSPLAEADDTAVVRQMSGICAQLGSAEATVDPRAVQMPAESECTPSCSQEPVLGFTAQLDEPIRCILSSPDGRCKSRDIAPRAPTECPSSGNENCCHCGQRTGKVCMCLIAHVIGMADPRCSECDLLVYN